MVIRTKLRAVLIPLLLYAVTGSIAGYFVWHAVNGERGLRTKQEYLRQMTELFTDLASLKEEHARWDHRVSLMRAEAIDRDLLEEEARVGLDLVDRRDLVVFATTRPR